MDITSLTREQLAGQRLMVSFEGTALDPDLRYLIDTLKVGGIVLFKNNVADPAQLGRLCRSVQEHARRCGQPPLLIAIDQEGGQVARLKPPFTQFPGNPAMGGTADARRFARVTAAELAGAGVNMNLAPVLDVAPADIDSIMAKRAFGGDPDWVSQMGATVIDGLQAGGIMAVGKHFPGIGRTVADSHLDMPSLQIDRAALQSVDLVPFEAAIGHEVAGIMLSHIRYPGLDPIWPASLSPAIAQDLLRRRMGYGGLVLTDDLDMGAIDKHFDFSDVIRQTLAADIDLALICHRSGRMETAFAQIAAALTDSQSMYQQGLAAARRILHTKRRYLEKRG